MRLAQTWLNLSRGDPVNVYDTDDVVFSIAMAFHILIELVSEVLLDVLAKECGMDCNVAIEISEEEHRDDGCVRMIE